MVFLEWVLIIGYVSEKQNILTFILNIFIDFYKH